MDFPECALKLGEIVLLAKNPPWPSVALIYSSRYLLIAVKSKLNVELG